MGGWRGGELATVGEAEELEIAGLRRDGSLRRPLTIWVVPLDDELYVRSVNGPGSAWYRGAQQRHQGRIRAGPHNQRRGALHDDPTGASLDPKLGERTWNA